MPDMDEEYQGLPEQAPLKQRGGRRPESAGAKVTVACKLPAGFRLRNFKMVPHREPILGGGYRETTIADPVGEDILINGVSVAFGMSPRHEVVAGFALTHGVDKDAWDQWLADNEKSAMVKNGLVFAYEKADKTIGQAKEMRDARSGLEPFAPSDDPSKQRDPRAPRRSSQNLSEVTRATDDMAA